MATIKELTGGTGDVNPQVLTLTTTQTAADTTTTNEFPIPVPRPSSSKGKSIVMEILQVKYNVGNLVAPAGQIFIQGLLSTDGSTIETSPTVFSSFSRDGLFATAVGFSYSSRRFEDVLHDGAGHGFLVGTDSLFLCVNSGATGAVNRVTAKVFYRFKEVTLAEYIGIVQGQQ